MGPVVEKKVQATSAAAFVSGAGMWALGTYVFKGTVPPVLASWLYAVIPGFLTFAAGYVTKHTERPDLAPPGPFPRGTVMTPVGPMLPFSSGGTGSVVSPQLGDLGTLPGNRVTLSPPRRPPRVPDS